MANLEHIALLKKSTPKWNEWRRENPRITPDLIWANLQGANLRGANLIEANLQGAFFYEANLIGVYLNRADLTGATNLTCEQIASVATIDENTKFPDYLRVKITGHNVWKCKEWKFRT